MVKSDLFNRLLNGHEEIPSSFYIQNNTHFFRNHRSSPPKTLPSIPHNSSFPVRTQITTLYRPIHSTSIPRALKYSGVQRRRLAAECLCNANLYSSRLHLYVYIHIYTGAPRSSSVVKNVIRRLSLALSLAVYRMQIPGSSFVRAQCRQRGAINGSFVERR